MFSNKLGLFPFTCTENASLRIYFACSMLVPTKIRIFSAVHLYIPSSPKGSFTSPHFHQFLMGTRYFLCTVKKYKDWVASLFLFAKNITPLSLILFLLWFFKVKTLKIPSKFITLLSYTVKSIKNINACFFRTIKDSMKISTDMSSLKG